MPCTNLVLSYGDLSRQSGYRTRVIEELTHIEMGSRFRPVLMAFDRHFDHLDRDSLPETELKLRSRHAFLSFYADLYRLSRPRKIAMVHAHNLYSAALALSARPFFRYSLVLDLHGRIPEEYISLGKGGSISRKLLEILESIAVRYADHVIVVSDQLREYLSRTYGVPDARISTIPMCADAESFRVDASLRGRARSRLKLEQKFVCTHLGSVFEWYDPSLIIETFQDLRRSIPESHLLLVTERTEEVERHVRSYLEDNAFTVVGVRHSEVPELLNASDLGLVLLARSPNIATSSPAKFAEYMNCGVPVLISPDVGDFSALVKRMNVGYVIKADDRPIEEFFNEVRSDRSAYVSRCQQVGQALTWKAHRTTWNQIVSGIVCR